MNDNAQTQLQEPQAGGSYRREADGTLTQISGSQTSQIGGRAAQAQAQIEAGQAPVPVAATPNTDNSQE
ncbi:hypothetical protein ACFPOE_11370 [Caenimonas terrae]|uniref:Uncharacterized protein n=1 Tax=Caenimonas terrae TaxID=696074 RepID=A0ABW0NBV7_9BURK